MESNGSTVNAPEREMTSLEFHLALLNKAHNIVSDGEIMETCMWLIPFISGPGHVWWSIYPSENEGIELSSVSEEWVFTFEFHKDHGFVKLTGDCYHMSEPKSHEHVTIDFIDLDKLPQEYLGMANLIELHRKFSQAQELVDPGWKKRMIESDVPFG